jgi:glycine dehydrogenase subunit 2
MIQYEKMIFDLSKKGRKGYCLPVDDFTGLNAEDLFPQALKREEKADLPELSEGQVVRHYTNLSNKNFGVDTGFYPLGSCTMKYNPKINEEMAALPGLTCIHPLQPEESAQGALELMYDLGEQIKEITGMDAVSLQPAAGAHGELTGMMMIKAYHEAREDFKRTKIIVPDTAHGTNPATAAMIGFEIVQVPSDQTGGVDVEAFKAALSDEVAGLMLTNPSTLGLFEKNIEEIAALMHEAGGLLYYDGANLNAIMGKTRPGDMGFDVVHLNLHKTMSTPHGGGGPGAGPVGVKQRVAEFLPKPVVIKDGESFRFDHDRPLSIGKVKGFYGNFGVLVKAYSYILTMGAQGLKAASEMAVLNANYMQARLKEDYVLPFDTICKHEFVLDGLKGMSEMGVTTLDVAKRLLDHGYHPPTVYFPLIVHNALMIEPTETESLETLDIFCDVMIEIAKEAKEAPELLTQAPTTTVIRRVDEVRAARKPVLSWTKEAE